MRLTARYFHILPVTLHYDLGGALEGSGLRLPLARDAGSAGTPNSSCVSPSPRRAEPPALSLLLLTQLLEVRLVPRVRPSGSLHKTEVLGPKIWLNLTVTSQGGGAAMPVTSH